MNLRIVAILFLLVGSIGSAQSQIKASNKNGELSFAGEHVGMQFSGVFNKWDATLLLPPAAKPVINATFDLSSAKTGDSTYDATLPEGDWFDVENHPQGTFTSTSIEQSGNEYKVSGNLSLRGQSLPIDFVLSKNGGSLEASFKIDRLKYAIGLDSDPDAEWVGQYIEMNLVIKP
jgi:polyisoprenoid-binding protein YceI